MHACELRKQVILPCSGYMYFLLLVFFDLGWPGMSLLKLNGLAVSKYATDSSMVAKSF